MVYDHMVKKNGVYYQAWQPIPEDNNVEEIESLPPYSDSEIAFETQEEKRYTKTEINKMSTEELQNLAANIGIDGAFEMTGVDLKKKLISELNL